MQSWSFAGAWSVGMSLYDLYTWKNTYVAWARGLARISEDEVSIVVSDHDFCFPSFNTLRTGMQTSELMWPARFQAYSVFDFNIWAFRFLKVEIGIILIIHAPSIVVHWSVAGRAYWVAWMCTLRGWTELNFGDGRGWDVQRKQSFPDPDFESYKTEVSSSIR